MSHSSLKKSSLRRKDTMWIYKNPQGLQLLENELNERRKKRFARNKTSPVQKSMPSPLILSPKPIQPEQVIPVAMPSSPPIVEKSFNSLSTSKDSQPSISQLKQALENKNHATTTIPIARPAPLNKEILSFGSQDTVSKANTPKKEQPSYMTKKEIIAEVRTKPIDQSLLNKFNNKDIIRGDVNYKSEVFLKERRNSLLPNQQPTAAPINKGLEGRKQALFTLSNKNAECVSPKKETRPLRTLNNTRKNPTEPILKKEETFNTTLKTRPPPRVSSLPSSDTQSNNFLLEAKQKLFAVQQQQQRQVQNPVKKTLPITPPVKHSNVTSFISAFETPAAVGPPPKLPQHFEVPSKASLSTPLTPPASKIIPPSSNSTMLPRQQSESYFSPVLDRRYNNISPASSEDSIQMYLPQLSPELSFCNTDTLDVPSSDDEDDIVPENGRPCIKKRVSFSEQLSTVIPDDESEVTEDEQPMMNSMTRFTHTLSQELTETSTMLAAEKKVNPLPREKYIPVPVVVKKPAVRPTLNHQQTPQKLSNKLLDMFQKKPKEESKVNNTVPEAPPKLTHLTKSRPRKPASLKKPTTLAYPAAIAQPDWRTRAIGSKNIYSLS